MVEEVLAGELWRASSVQNFFSGRGAVEALSCGVCGVRSWTEIIPGKADFKSENLLCWLEAIAG